MPQAGKRDLLPVFPELAGVRAPHSWQEAGSASRVEEDTATQHAPAQIQAGSLNEPSRHAAGHGEPGAGTGCEAAGRQKMSIFTSFQARFESARE